MLKDYLPADRVVLPQHDADLIQLRGAGRQIAKALTLVPSSRAACAALKQKSKHAAEAIDAVLHKKSLHHTEARWLVDNYRLILTAEKETRQLAASFLEFRSVTHAGATGPEPLPYTVAKAYLGAALESVSYDGLSAFLEGFQEIRPLDMGEIWALKPALQFVLVERIAQAPGTPGVSLSVLITSLRAVGESDWKDLFESVSVTNAVLARDPAEFFLAMDFASRDQYRNVVTWLAKRSQLSEPLVAEAAIQLAKDGSSPRETHVGYWL
ncbi:MAG: hypothetical protein H7Y20_01500, partial [Bryobacteraceae bacterium]|nr:hypothetical protein [Bryobacteraceae bacterium]